MQRKKLTMPTDSDSDSSYETSDSESEESDSESESESDDDVGAGFIYATRKAPEAVKAAAVSAKSLDSDSDETTLPSRSEGQAHVNLEASKRYTGEDSRDDSGIGTLIDSTPAERSSTENDITANIGALEDLDEDNSTVTEDVVSEETSVVVSSTLNEKHKIVENRETTSSIEEYPEASVTGKLAIQVVDPISRTVTREKTPEGKAPAAVEYKIDIKSTSNVNNQSKTQHTNIREIDKRNEIALSQHLVHIPQTTRTRTRTNNLATTSKKINVSEVERESEMANNLSVRNIVRNKEPEEIDTKYVEIEEKPSSINSESEDKQVNGQQRLRKRENHETTKSIEIPENNVGFERRRRRLSPNENMNEISNVTPVSPRTRKRSDDLIRATNDKSTRDKNVFTSVDPISDEVQRRDAKVTEESTNINFDSNSFLNGSNFRKRSTTVLPNKEIPSESKDKSPVRSRLNTRVNGTNQTVKNSSQSIEGKSSEGVIEHAQMNKSNELELKVAKKELKKVVDSWYEEEVQSPNKEARPNGTMPDKLTSKNGEQTVKVMKKEATTPSFEHPRVRQLNNENKCSNSYIQRRKRRNQLEEIDKTNNRDNSPLRNKRTSKKPRKSVGLLKTLSREIMYIPISYESMFPQESKANQENKENVATNEDVTKRKSRSAVKELTHSTSIRTHSKESVRSSSSKTMRRRSRDKALPPEQTERLCTLNIAGCEAIEARDGDDGMRANLIMSEPVSGDSEDDLLEAVPVTYKAEFKTEKLEPKSSEKSQSVEKVAPSSVAQPVKVIEKYDSGTNLENCNISVSPKVVIISELKKNLPESKKITPSNLELNKTPTTENKLASWIMNIGKEQKIEKKLSPVASTNELVSRFETNPKSPNLPRRTPPVTNKTGSSESNAAKRQPELRTRRQSNIVTIDLRNKDENIQTPWGVLCRSSSRNSIDKSQTPLNESPASKKTLQSNKVDPPSITVNQDMVSSAKNTATKVKSPSPVRYKPPTIENLPTGRPTKERSRSPSQRNVSDRPPAPVRPTSIALNASRTPQPDTVRKRTNSVENRWSQRPSSLYGLKSPDSINLSRRDSSKETPQEIGRLKPSPATTPMGSSKKLFNPLLFSTHDRISQFEKKDNLPRTQKPILRSRTSMALGSSDPNSAGKSSLMGPDRTRLTRPSMITSKR